MSEDNIVHVSIMRDFLFGHKCQIIHCVSEVIENPLGNRKNIPYMLLFCVNVQHVESSIHKC